MSNVHRVLFFMHNIYIWSCIIKFSFLVSSTNNDQKGMFIYW